MIDAATLDILAISRNWALILFALYGLAVATLTLVVVWPLLRGVRKLRSQLPWHMHQVQTASATARRGVQQAMQSVCMPFFWLEQVSAQSRAAAQRLRGVLGRFAPGRR